MINTYGMIGQTISSLPMPYEHINNIKIENGIYDDLYATAINEEAREVNNFVVPNVWQLETFLHAKLDGDLFAGNTDFGVENTTNIIVKRRKTGTYKWFPLFDIAADKSTDYNFVIIDPYAPIGNYEYAVVPIVNGVEGTYFIAQCEVKFDKLVIIDKDSIYSTNLDIKIEKKKNNSSSTILPIQARYPIYVSNAMNDYYTGNISAMFLKVSDGKYITKDTVGYRNEVLDFLNNRKVKFIKSPYGECWIASVAPTIEDSENGHYEAHNISFDFTEVGDIESSEDMNKFGLLTIGEEWWG